MITTLKSDVQILARLLRGRSLQGTHQQQLESFYGPQAEQYDAFRERLLHGRKRLLEQLDVRPEYTLVELGAGTGRNLRFLDQPLQSFKKIEIVDLCPSLLAIAKNQYQRMNNIHVVEADATTYQPDQSVDRVYLSYALTMIPDWKRTIENAVAMLKPGGKLGVVDFYVSADTANVGNVQHGQMTRKFWRGWFAHDGVNLNPAHLQYLQTICRPLYLKEEFGSVPYLPFLKAPYYIFVGQKPDS